MEAQNVFFADFFDYYSGSNAAQFKLHWLIDQYSVNHLHKVNKLKSTKNISYLRIYSNRFKRILENLQLLVFLITHRISILHVPLYNKYYLSFLEFLQRIPSGIRPKISISIVDASLSFNYSNTNSPKHAATIDTYDTLFKKISVDGYFAWNREFVSFISHYNLLKNRNATLYAIKSRFCDTAKFTPSIQKENVVVYASRLVLFKNADWFLKAVEILSKKDAALMRNWKFLICGDGPLKQELLNYAKDLKIDHLVEFRIEPSLEKILNFSKCFVSCMDFDNFPSLSMAEAMAAGNVIVSRNVGQTSLFVEDNKNGFLSKEDSPEGVAESLLDFLQNQHRFKEMSEHSIHLMKQVHTPGNFVPQIDEYWNLLLHKTS